MPPNNMHDEKITLTSKIGDKLRQAREKRSITMEQAQKQTHIHTTVISALESGKCDDILTPNYVKSFLKEYSAFLGLDAREIVNEYLSLHPELKVRNINLMQNKSDGTSVGLGAVVSFIKIALVFVIVISAAVFIWSKAAHLFKKPKNTKTAVVRPSKAPAKTGKAPKTAVAQRSFLAKNVPFKMTLKIKNPVMIRLKKDGTLIFQRVLAKDAEETFSVNKSINMFIARAEYVEILINGKSLGSPGRGVIESLDVTSNGFRAR